MKKHLINQKIIHSPLRIIDPDGRQMGILDREEALAEAQSHQLDLVLIADQADPPVCRIMDYGKFHYEARRKSALARKKQKNTQIKEVKFRPGTEEGDYRIKLRNTERFLGEGNKVKVTVRFRGREIMHKELGMELLQRIAADLEACAVVEQPPKLEGRQMVMVLAPGKGRKI